MLKHSESVLVITKLSSKTYIVSVAKNDHENDYYRVSKSSMKRIETFIASHDVERSDFHKDNHTAWISIYHYDLFDNSDDSFNRLVSEYTAQIENDFDWDDIKESCKDSIDEYNEADYGDFIGRDYLGTVFSLMPSGKYYAAWTSNQSSYNEFIDSAYSEALNKVADKHGLFVENGENDPCDLFACLVVAYDDTEEVD